MKVTGIRRKLRKENSPALALYRLQRVAKETAERNVVRKRDYAVRKLRQVEKDANYRNIIGELNRKLDNNQIFSMRLTKIDKNIGMERFFKHLITIPGKFIITIGDISYTLNDRNRTRLMKMIMRDLEPEEEHGSDKNIIGAYKSLEGNIVIESHQNVARRQFLEGAFFKYTHNTAIDLSRYGIFKTGESQNHGDTCLIHALRMGGLEETVIECIKLIVRNRTIPLSSLNKVCNVGNFQIRLNRSNWKNVKIYGNHKDRIFNIGLIDEHYFLNELTDITSYAIENYEKVKDLKDYNKIIGYNDNRYVRKTGRSIDSFKLIQLLLSTPGLLTEMTMDMRNMATTQFYNCISPEIISLEYDVEKDIKPVGSSSYLNETNYQNIVFDFETYTDDNYDKKHIPYLVRIFSHNDVDVNGIISKQTINRVFYGEDCGLQMLQSLKSDTRLIAHNCSYDYRFLLPYLSHIKEISRGTRLIGANAIFYTFDDEIKIQLKDSYHLITEPLRKFPAIFGLPCVKEVMPYDLYKKDTVIKRYMNIQNVLDTHIKLEDREQFLNNIKRWDLEKDGEYDIVKYSSKYCELDCKILWDGYNTFRRWMLDCVQLDINDILTSASLSHRYLIKQGCYDGVNQLSGIPQMFIQGCVVGGRTMISENKKISLQDRVNDFDAVSLYPSAMVRMPGFLKGVPKIIQNLDYNDLKTKDGYFVDVRITSVGVNRNFPLASVVEENGIRNFTNDIVGTVLRVDKISLEDLIQFQGITFDIIRGYYFDEGFNTKVKTVIQYLFEERLKKKKEGNPSQTIYKLIMNSCYGKTIMKPIEIESKFFDDNASFQVYLSRHYNWIESYVRFGDKIKVNVVKPLADQSNISQVGVSILSMSKRIMNEVMCLAEDNGLDLFYQDTDSMHIRDSDISTLSKVFKSTYGRDLIGKNMGQFHSDFELEGCKEIIARRSIFLGKKSYADELVGIDSNGKEVIGYHTRMKGIPQSCLEYAWKKHGYSNIFELYQDLYKGVNIVIDLTNDGKKANFEMRDDYSIHTLSSFTRTLSF